jgi:50S ribosomal protein L16 3-hydroxylase
VAKRGLSSFFPDQVARFLNEAWPGNPFVIHGLSDSVQTLTELPFLQSLETMLNAWPNSVQAHLPDVADESSSIDVTPKDAPKAFSNRMGLLFNNVQSISPELELWLTALREDLGLPVSAYARCMVYATPDRKGTAAHFDQNVNFVLQLHGTKKWTIAANENVVNPTERFAIGQPMTSELASYFEGATPFKMPSDAQEVVLAPGSLLFVPRGYWHETSAEGDALALNFTFSQPAWVDLFTAALRSRLVLSPEWRELADGVNSKDPILKERAERNLDALLLELREDLPNWLAADIIGATEGS